MGRNAIDTQGQAALIKAGIATQADFSDEDSPPVGAAAAAVGVPRAQPPGATGKSFSEVTMTQQQRDAQMAKDRAAADANRIQSMQRNAASKRALPAQTWSPDN